MIPTAPETLERMLADPYPVYARLRREAPACLLKATGRVLLTRHADCRAAKLDAATFRSRDTGTPAERAFRATTMMRLDGLPHAAERRAMQPALGARSMARWRAAYARAAEGMLDALPHGEADLMAALLGPWAGAGLAAVIGLDADGRAMARWSQDLIDGAGNLAGDPEIWARCEASGAEVDAAIGRALPAPPEGSMLAAMTAAAAPRERISCNVKVVIGGGVNEPRDAAATAVFALLTHPGQLAEVRARGLWAEAFEEAVRWVAPIQTSPRRTAREVRIGAATLPAGTPVSIVQGSANRDEAVWDRPEAFDVRRGAAGHQAFSNGAHFCLGAHLARMAVGEVMLPMLWERRPGIALADPEGVRWHGFTFRGPTALQVAA